MGWDAGSGVMRGAKADMRLRDFWRIFRTRGRNAMKRRTIFSRQRREARERTEFVTRFGEARRFLNVEESERRGRETAIGEATNGDVGGGVARNELRGNAFEKRAK